MKSKTVYFALGLVAVLCVTFVYFVSGFAPVGQTEVVSSVVITDVTKGYVLTPEFASQSSMKWLTVIPYDQPEFTTGNTYVQGVWLYRNPVGDVDFVATVWGPDDSGSGYYVELARLSSSKIQISYSGGTIYIPEITDWSNEVQEGYIVLKLMVVG